MKLHAEVTDMQLQIPLPWIAQHVIGEIKTVC